MHIYTRSCTYLCLVNIEGDPLDEDHEHQPAKYSHQEQDLGDELQEDVDVLFEVPAGRVTPWSHQE